MLTSTPDFVTFRVRHELDDQRSGTAGAILGGLLGPADSISSVDVARLKLDSECAAQVDRQTRQTGNGSVGAISLKLSTVHSFSCSL